MVLDIQFTENNNRLDLSLDNNNTFPVNFDERMVIVFEKVKDVIVKDGSQQASVVDENRNAIIDLTEYAKDSDLNNYALNNDLNAEIQARSNADNQLQQNITNEANARYQNDQALTQSIQTTNRIKQDKIDNTNKLNADYVKNGSTNKVVTQSEKDIWNNKQNKIDGSNKVNADYVNDTASDNKFVNNQILTNINFNTNARHSHNNSAVLNTITVDNLVTTTEKNTWNGKQNKIDVNNKLDADYVKNGSTNKVVTQSEKDIWNGKASIDDTDTSSTTKTWSANKLNSIFGGIEDAIDAIRGVS